MKQFRVNLLAGGHFQRTADDHLGHVAIHIGRRHGLHKAAAHVGEHNSVEAEQTFECEYRLAPGQWSTGIEIDFNGGNILPAQNNFPCHLLEHIEYLQGRIIAEYD